MYFSVLISHQVLLLQQRVHHFLHHYPLDSHYILNMSLLFSPLYPYKHPENWLGRVLSFPLFFQSTFSFLWVKYMVRSNCNMFWLNRRDERVDFKGGVLCLNKEFNSFIHLVQVSWWGWGGSYYLPWSKDINISSKWPLNGPGCIPLTVVVHPPTTTHTNTNWHTQTPHPAFIITPFHRCSVWQTAFTAWVQHNTASLR